MTWPSTLVVILLVCAGIALLCASLLPLSDILRILCDRSLQRKWVWLTALVILFIPGYATFGCMRIGGQSTVADLVVAAILFFGACFVASVAFLSRQTARDLLRIAGLERDAFTDPLTQLFNRRYLSHRFNEEVFRAHRYRTELAVILVDVDYFKRVNDTWGHRAGDEVLRQVAQRIRAELRTGDIAVRYGGDELLVIAIHSDCARAGLIAERIRRNARENPVITVSGSVIPITLSIGVASLLADENAGTLIHRVDCALYHAKQAGRDRICVAQATDAPCAQEQPKEDAAEEPCTTTRA